MSDRRAKKIVGLLAVGFDAEDGHIRITQGDQYDVIMGSEENHAYMSQLIRQIERRIDESGLSLEELTPETLKELIQSLE